METKINAQWNQQLMLPLRVIKLKVGLITMDFHSTETGSSDLWDVHQQGHQPRTFILQFLNFELSPWWQNVTKSCSSLIVQSKSELLQITFAQFVKRIIVIAWKSSDVSKQIKKCQSQQINLDRRDAGHKTCNIIPVGISVCYIVPICGHNWYKNMSCYYWYLRCGVLDG